MKVSELFEAAKDKPQSAYEMMFSNGKIKKFTAKDDNDAKRIAKGLGAKSVIRLKNGVPAGKIT